MGKKKSRELDEKSWLRACAWVKIEKWIAWKKQKLFYNENRFARRDWSLENGISEKRKLRRAFLCLVLFTRYIVAPKRRRWVLNKITRVWSASCKRIRNGYGGGVKRLEWKENRYIRTSKEEEAKPAVCAIAVRVAHPQDDETSIVRPTKNERWLRRDERWRSDQERTFYSLVELSFHLFSTIWNLHLENYECDPTIASVIELHRRMFMRLCVWKFQNATWTRDAWKDTFRISDVCDIYGRLHVTRTKIRWFLS